MYIIYSEKTQKALKTWTYLQPSDRGTEVVTRARDELAKSYPDDNLIVMHTVASGQL